MYTTINIEGRNYNLDLTRAYLEKAEKYLLKSKIEKSREEEYIKKAEDLVEKAKITNILEKPIIRNKFSLLKRPGTKFKDIAGLNELKEKLKLKIIEPLKNQELFKMFGKKFGGGLIMYGPPGCGKSLIAEAVAGESDVNYLNVKVSDIKSKYVGETERNISELFKTARETQPCIIFFDEFESLGRDRDSAVGHDKSMISQFLTEMDSVGNKDQQIMLIAATNEPWSIDLALRREGRFGNSIFVAPPDFEARLGILKLQLKDKPVEEDFDFELVANITGFYSGADLVEVCNSAVEKVIAECLNNKTLRRIKTDDLVGAIKNKKEIVTIKWFRKALDIIEATHNHDSFKEVIDYVNDMAKINVMTT